MTISIFINDCLRPQFNSVYRKTLQQRSVELYLGIIFKFTKLEEGVEKRISSTVTSSFVQWLLGDFRSGCATNSNQFI